MSDLSMGCFLPGKKVNQYVVRKKMKTGLTPLALRQSRSTDPYIGLLFIHVY